MLRLTYLVTAVTAAVAIASVVKPNHGEVPVLGVTENAYPPSRNPITNTIFRNYDEYNCNTTSFNTEYDMVPDNCYSLPGNGGNLLFHDCGRGEFLQLELRRAPLSYSVATPPPFSA